MEKITANHLAELFNAVGQVMEAKADELGEMDARMGDGDLGLTMKKGFTALPALLTEMEELDVGVRLAKAGMKMTSIVPSTMGTLMASGIMSGGKALTGQDGMDAEGFASYLQGFADGIAKRGKCAVGDRTVLDAVQGAADSAAQVLSSGTEVTLKAVAQAALNGARAGVEATKNMQPKFGKAAVFADKAMGIPDQGAYAGCLMIQGYYNYICM